jgi:hypothetical protein
MCIRFPTRGILSSQGNERQQLVGPLHQRCSPVVGAAHLAWTMGYEHGSTMLASDSLSSIFSANVEASAAGGAILREICQMRHLSLPC